MEVKESRKLSCCVFPVSRRQILKESKTGLRFEIGPNDDDFPTRSQLLTRIVCHLKDMVKSSQLSKDEPLTPNVNKVMGVWFFRRRAQNTKIGKIWTSQFCFFIFLSKTRRDKSVSENFN